MKATFLAIAYLFTIAFANLQDNYIVIHTNDFSLQVYDCSHHLLDRFPVGIGENGAYKTTKEDRKTPIGNYEILWKASAYYQEDGGYPITEEVGFCSHNTYSQKEKDKENSLWQDAYGKEDAVVMHLNYPNASDLEKGYSGYGIAIHATCLGGIGSRVSLGCIRMYPKDARKLYCMIDAGSKVIIKE